MKTQDRTDQSKEVGGAPQQRPMMAIGSLENLQILQDCGLLPSLDGTMSHLAEISDTVVILGRSKCAPHQCSSMPFSTYRVCMRETQGKLPSSTQEPSDVRVDRHAEKNPPNGIGTYKSRRARLSRSKPKQESPKTKVWKVEPELVPDQVSFGEKTRQEVLEGASVVIGGDAWGRIVGELSPKKESQKQWGSYSQMPTGLWLQENITIDLMSQNQSPCLSETEEQDPKKDRKAVLPESRENQNWSPSLNDVVCATEALAARSKVLSPGGVRSHQAGNKKLSKNQKITKNEGFIKRHVINEITGRTNQVLECASCNKRFSKLYNARVHARTHDSNRPYECAFCSQKFLYKGNRDMHETQRVCQREPLSGKERAPNVKSRALKTQTRSEPHSLVKIKL